MSEVKHTPGPWSHRNGRIFQADREELTIGHVARAFDGDYCPANGDLMAAAPGLLEACLRWQANIDAGLGYDWDLQFSQDDIDSLNAAIAKATGNATKPV